MGGGGEFRIRSLTLFPVFYALYPYAYAGGPGGYTAAVALASSPGLERLRLDTCGLSTEGVQHLATALAGNKVRFLAVFPSLNHSVVLRF